MKLDEFESLREITENQQQKRCKKASDSSKIKRKHRMHYAEKVTQYTMLQNLYYK